MSPSTFIVGLDLGQTNDFSAWATVLRERPSSCAMARRDLPSAARCRICCHISTVSTSFLLPAQEGP